MDCRPLFVGPLTMLVMIDYQIAGTTCYELNESSNTICGRTMGFTTSRTAVVGRRTARTTTTGGTMFEQQPVLTAVMLTRVCGST